MGVTLQARMDMWSDPLVRKAIAYAVARHDGQKRNNGSDYITHPLEVAEALAAVNEPDFVICAGILHDAPERAVDLARHRIKEDGRQLSEGEVHRRLLAARDAELRRIAEAFSDRPEIAELVALVTDNPTLARERRRQAQIAAVRDPRHSGVVAIRLADKRSNSLSDSRMLQEWALSLYTGPQPSSLQGQPAYLPNSAIKRGQQRRDTIEQMQSYNVFVKDIAEAARGKHPLLEDMLRRCIVSFEGTLNGYGKLADYFHRDPPSSHGKSEETPPPPPSVGCLPA